MQSVARKPLCEHWNIGRVGQRENRKEPVGTVIKAREPVWSIFGIYVAAMCPIPGGIPGMVCHYGGAPFTDRCQVRRPRGRPCHPHAGCADCVINRHKPS